MMRDVIFVLIPGGPHTNGSVAAGSDICGHVD